MPNKTGHSDTVRKVLLSVVPKLYIIAQSRFSIIKFIIYLIERLIYLYSIVIEPGFSTNSKFCGRISEYSYLFRDYKFVFYQSVSFHLGNLILIGCWYIHHKPLKLLPYLLNKITSGKYCSDCFADPDS